MTSVMKILNRAVLERKSIVVRCNGHHSIRIIEPHVIYTTASGEIVVECFQTRGYTESGNPPPLWTRFRLASIRSAYPLNDTFDVRLEEGYNPEKNDYKHGLIAMVKLPEPEVEIDELEEKGAAYLQGKTLLGRLGSTIDNILSNQVIANKVH